MYHSEEAARKAEEEFDRIFIKKDIPDDIAEKVVKKGNSISIIELIVDVNFAPSKGEARRLVQQGGVSINGNKITDVTYDVVFDGEQILKVGKRKFLKLIAK
jgi:tyrosyl-tRNA synthetase